MIGLEDNTLTSFYTVNRMLSFGGNYGDRLLCVATNEDLANNYKILLIYVTNAGTAIIPSYDTDFK